MTKEPSPPDKAEELSLAKAAEALLNECRMVLPGIQALFGFQLIAVFNPGFSEKLGVTEQRLHLVAISLVAIAVALIMTPAALHRIAGSREVTEAFLRNSSRLLLCSMLPLALGICIDVYLIALMVMGRGPGSILAGCLFALYLVLWFVFPVVHRLRHHSAAGR